MKTIKLTVASVLMFVCSVAFSQSTVIVNFEGVELNDTISLANFENIKEFKITEVSNLTKTIADFQLLRYSAAIVPKESQAEFIYCNSNIISNTFIELLRKKSGFVKIIFDEIQIQNNTNGDVLKAIPYYFYIKI